MISASSRNRARLSGSSALVCADLLQRHLAVQLLVVGDEDLPQAAPGVGPEDLVATLHGRSCRAGTRIAIGTDRGRWRGWLAMREVGLGRGIGAAVLGAAGQPDERQAGLEPRVGHAFQVVPGRVEGRQRRQAQLRVPAVELEVLPDQCLEQGKAPGIERRAVPEDLSQEPGPVRDPGGEGGHQVVAAHEVVLERRIPSRRLCAVSMPAGAGVSRSPIEPETDPSTPSGMSVLPGGCRRHPTRHPFGDYTQAEGPRIRKTELPARLWVPRAGPRSAH